MCFHQFNLLCACFVFGCVIKCAYCSGREAKREENSGHDRSLLRHDVFLERIFAKYGKDGRISYDSFRGLLKNLVAGREETRCDEDRRESRHRHLSDGENESDLPHFESPSEIGEEEMRGHSDKIWNLTSLLEQYPINQSLLSLVIGGKCISGVNLSHASQEGVTPLHFLNLCPALIYEMDKPRCVVQDKRLQQNDDTLAPSLQIWLFSTLAVVVISLCGLLSVAVVPLIHRLFYQSLLQFLIGLAVGSLSGDALLHLLPHAMTGLGHSDHQGATNTGEDHDDHHHRQETYIWTGLVALTGIYVFYIAERFLNLAMACYSGKKTLKTTSQVSRLTFAVRSMDSEQCKSVGEKLSHHKHEDDEEDVADDRHAHEKLVESETKSEGTRGNLGTFSVDGNDGDNVDVCHTERVIFQNKDKSQSCVVAVTDHHHHSHRHTHAGTVSAVAWMVIMGDGLHNLCDGLAIGAAFVSGLSSGVSTTVAVFCHELPHELGDFAMLLKAGMPVRQALLYNGLSSFLCFVGMLVGVLLGSVGSATLWVFAGAAGMFLYIALVDMLPELENVSSESLSTGAKHFLLQILGIVLGVSVMLVIALYEHDLKHLIR